VVVVSGKSYVEVKRCDVDKGVAVSRVLAEMRRQCRSDVEIPQFILCIGDDRSDEDMFEAVNKMFQRQPGEFDPSNAPMSPTLRKPASDVFKPPARTTPVACEMCVSEQGSMSRVSTGLTGMSKASSMNTMAEPTSPLPERFETVGEGSAAPSSPLYKASPEPHCWPPASAMPSSKTASVASETSRSSMMTKKKASMTIEDLHSMNESDRTKFYTVTVGRKISAAQYFVKDVEEVGELVKKLAQQTICSSFGRYNSMPAVTQMMGEVLSSSEDEDAVKGPQFEPARPRASTATLDDLDDSPDSPNGSNSSQPGFGDKQRLGLPLVTEI